jgi:hypothetical protein
MITSFHHSVKAVGLGFGYKWVCGRESKNGGGEAVKVVNPVGG